MSTLKCFSTPHYHGAWFPFDGDRMKFRAMVETHLRTELADADGKLMVNEKGPHWQGSSALQISYAHSADLALLVYSQTHRLGVDFESGARVLSQDPAVLAERFFHPEIAQKIAILKTPELKRLEFLRQWVKLESYVKLTRSGLKNALSTSEIEMKGSHFSEVPVAPKGVFSSIALSTL